MIVEKYRPKSLDDLIGQEEVVNFVREWARKWEEGYPQKPLLLYGRPGCGKTSLAHALARDMNWEILEMNASDMRNKSSIEAILPSASTQSTLTGQKRLIVIDEVDGLAGQEDRGGVSALLGVIDETKQPMILIANQVFIQKLKSLLPEVEKIEMKPVNARILKSYLKKIAEKEGLNISDEKIGEIVERANGDVRSALIDLTSVVVYRDREKDVYRAVAQVFKAQDYQTARSAFWDVDIDPDMQMLWMEENIPNEYTSLSDVKDAFEYLSRADVFYGRISRRQSWGLLRYALELATAGVASAKKQNANRFVKYRFPSYLQRMSYTVSSRAIINSACRKIGERMHLSSKEVQMQIRFILPFVLKNPEYYKLSDIEVKSLLSALGKK